MFKISPKLYRRRYIPDELTHLKDDEILYSGPQMIKTKWNVLKPRSDFSHGVSCYFLDKGFKVSKFLDASNTLVYYYCDIIKTDFSGDYVFCDLLIDVIVYPDGFVKVVDVGEVTEALDGGLITAADVKYALTALDSLLKIIYSGNFSSLTDELEF